MANHRAGGRTRLSTIASAGTLLLGGLLFPAVVTHLPLVVLAAILSAEDLTRVLAREPRMGQAILGLVASQLSERLRETIKTS